MLPTVDPAPVSACLGAPVWSVAKSLLLRALDEHPVLVRTSGLFCVSCWSEQSLLEGGEADTNPWELVVWKGGLGCVDVINASLRYIL